MRKLKDNNTVFKAQSENYDTKKKLNRLEKAIDSAYIEQIENGITIEDLDKMKSSGIPIFKYSTQITIHGQFQELNNISFYGYKHVFQNKNKSIGVKYNAIDKDKIKLIASRSKAIDLKYFENSSERYFYKYWLFDKTTFEDVSTTAKELLDKFNTSLFYGYKQIYTGSLYGQLYLVLKVNIGAIYSENVEKLLTNIGATIEAGRAHEKQQQQEKEQREKKYIEDMNKSKERKAKAMQSAQDDIDYLESKYNKAEKTSSEGTYLKPVITYDNKLHWQSIIIYTPTRAKKPRINRKNFDTFKEALSHSPAPSFMDQIFNGRITAYKIK